MFGACCCISKLSLPQRQLQVLLKLNHFRAATPQLTTGTRGGASPLQANTVGLASGALHLPPYLDALSQRIIEAIILTC